jgi:hypothetical protein
MPKNIAFTPTGATYGDDFTLIPTGSVKTATFSTQGRAVGYIHTLRLQMNVSAVSGTTPSMTAQVETSPDNSTWTAHPQGGFSAQTTTGSQRKIISALDRYVRITCTVTGTTPSFTFGITGESVGGENAD